MLRMKIGATAFGHERGRVVPSMSPDLALEIRASKRLEQERTLSGPESEMPLCIDHDMTRPRHSSCIGGPVQHLLGRGHGGEDGGVEGKGEVGREEVAGDLGGHGPGTGGNESELVEQSQGCSPIRHLGAPKRKCSCVALDVLQASVSAAVRKKRQIRPFSLVGWDEARTEAGVSAPPFLLTWQCRSRRRRRWHSREGRWRGACGRRRRGSSSAVRWGSEEPEQIERQRRGSDRMPERCCFVKFPL